MQDFKATESTINDDDVLCLPFLLKVPIFSTKFKVFVHSFGTTKPTDAFPTNNKNAHSSHYHRLIVR